jgi:hypothetical protein
VFALLAALAGCADANVITETYATLAQAVEAGAVDRGWVPRGLPPGSHDMREAHDLDSHRRWGLLNFPQTDAGAWRASLGAEVSVTGTVCEPPRRIEWWPVLLRGPLDDEPMKATGLLAYRGAGDGLIVIVHWKQGRAYYCTAV